MSFLDTNPRVYVSSMDRHRLMFADLAQNVFKEEKAGRHVGTPI
jgi:hypothetical protein